MMPILFAPESTDFSTNGLGGLSDAIECTVTEERNGAYELSMTYPVTGAKYDQIRVGSIIWAELDALRGKQAFRVYKISRPLNGRVTIDAQHISYWLSHVITGPFTATTVSAALAGLRSHAAEACPFNFLTDKATVATYTQSVPASIRSRLGGVQGSILDVYGGEYEFDNFDVHLWAARGANRGVTIRYGKNLTDIKQEENIANTITGVYPFWSADGGGYVELPEKVVSAPSAASYPYPRTIALDLSQNWQTAPTVAQLRAAANSYISRSGIGIPSVSIKLSFLALGDTVEYEDRANLERVGLCDTITVIYETLGVHATAKVVKTEWDVLAGRYVSIEVGDARTNLAETIAQTEEKAAEAVTGTALSDAIAKATSTITGVNGGYIKFNTDADGHPTEMLIMDSDDEATATNIWRYNAGGWGHSSDGGVTYTTAATLDGGIVADYITAGTLTGLRINNGNGTFEVDENGAVQASDMTITGGSMEVSTAEDTAVVKLTSTSGYSETMSNGFRFVRYTGTNTVVYQMLGNYLNMRMYSGNHVSDWEEQTAIATATLSTSGLAIANSSGSTMLSTSGLAIGSSTYADTWFAAINKVSGAGTITVSTGASQGMSNGTWTNLANIAHGTGNYIVTAYYTVTANATGYRTLMLTASATGSSPITTQARARVAAATGTETSVAVTTMIQATTAGTWYIRAIQNSGATLSATASEIRIMKISDI